MAKWLYKSYKDFIESDNKHLIGDEIIIDNGPGYYRIKFPYFVQISSDMLAGKMEKSKMTREEALEKIKPPRWYGDEGQRGWLLDSLEALGLLKFEEPSKRSEKGVRFKGANDVIYTVHDEMIDAKPIQKGKFTLIQMENGSFIQGNISHIEQP